jgi:hypothetical protein
MWDVRVFSRTRLILVLIPDLKQRRHYDIQREVKLNEVFEKWPDLANRAGREV